MNTTNEIHTLTGAYVLNAVSDIERREFENHMAHCAACAQEVLELQETTARLGQTTAMALPPALWETVHRSIRTTRQLPPLPLATPTSSRRARRRWPVRVAIGAVAASVVAAVTVGITMANREADLENQLAQSQSQVDRINTILGAPDATVQRRSEPDGRTATVVVSRRANGMVLTAQGLPPLSANQSFQGWFVTKDGTKTPMGLLHASHGTILVPDLTAAKDTSFLAITVEPRDGSTTPTGNVIITVPATT
ncbi:anti-sigma factor [Kibdelosporangium phytohabitans]|uniref:Regulator of SigK n=1 Tax=Kibdelosporangium phytohabitans TaxID=860235 RepID=A0A0N9HWD3_9PSEU|nr:anti-sigma factor [Kibdelosporangium phytohabitans]ALG06301.1 hypothetical protein AOZ06_04610 [Kibdelosporangium phytohabitans]MBE1467417.1 anti-sigma-K factor RskA [Kibdelosporangium phytohabitans]